MATGTISNILKDEYDIVFASGFTNGTHEVIQIANKLIINFNLLSTSNVSSGTVLASLKKNGVNHNASKTCQSLMISADLSKYSKANIDANSYNITTTSNLTANARYYTTLIVYV